MIYLIGGAPRCGKTILAKELSYKKRIPGISSDLVASIVKPYLPNNGKRKFSTASVCTTSPSVLLREEIRNAKILWPGIKRLILSLLKWRHDYIVEGVHLLPELVHEFEKMKEWETVRNEIRIVYLIKKDGQEIIKGFQSCDKESDWLLQCISTEQDFKNAAQMVIAKSKYIENKAQQFGYQVVNTDKDFKKSIKKLLATL